MTLRECIDDVLIRGLDDWVQAAEVASVARTTGGANTEDEVRHLSLRLFQDLLERDLVEVGTVTEKGFVVWGVPAADALQRIDKEWRALSKGPNLGDVCWLNLTEKGRVQADELWSRKRGKDP